VSLASRLNALPTNAPVRLEPPGPTPAEADDALCLKWAESLLATPACEALWTECLCGDATNDLDNQCHDPSSRSTDMSLSHPRLDAQGRHPSHFDTVRYCRQADPALLAHHQAGPCESHYRAFNDQDTLCIRLRPTDDSEWGIVCPDASLPKLCEHCHEISAHSTGVDKLEAVIRTHFWRPKIRDVVRHVVPKCTPCPQVRTAQRPQGQLAPRNVPVAPWSEVHIDHIGPWVVEVNGHSMQFDAPAMIGPVTSLIEIIRLDKTGGPDGPSTRRLFQNHWLARHPRPKRVVHDGGPEFEDNVSQLSLPEAGIERAYIAPHTPTANSIIETVHRTIGQIIRTYGHTRAPLNAGQAGQIVDDAIAAAVPACRCTPDSALKGASSGAVVFQRDMLLDIPVISDIFTLIKHRTTQVNDRLIRANARRANFDYQVGQQVFVRNFSRQNKLDLVYIGPFPILRVHTNNTVTTQRGPTHERINIRHIKPCDPSPPP